MTPIGWDILADSSNRVELRMKGSPQVSDSILAGPEKMTRCNGEFTQRESFSKSEFLDATSQEYHHDRHHPHRSPPMFRDTT
jgi:hypothetical protein